jgi:hypothetical protein
VADNKEMLDQLLGKQTQGKNTEEENNISYNSPFAVKV